MAKNVLVTVKSTRTSPENETEFIEAVYPGTLYLKNNNYYILYKETQQTGMENVTTSLKVEGERITIIRNGSVSMRQIFECGVVNRSLYQSNFGCMDMAVKPWHIEVHLTDIGGSIKLEYELELDGSNVGNTSLDIIIKEV